MALMNTLRACPPPVMLPPISPSSPTSPPSLRISGRGSARGGSASIALMNTLRACPHRFPSCRPAPPPAEPCLGTGRSARGEGGIPGGEWSRVEGWGDREGGLRGEGGGGGGGGDG
ncbi:unnamed protein product [Closterium sp. NIES-64]|nr:unnamed protein product [Closterium sp. NIES-64]